MAASRTLHVRCTTWEQVEVFHKRKLRHGKLLSMRVPFPAEVGAHVTLGLELPNQVVMAIDGVVQKASPMEGEAKTWIEVELSGFTEEVLARIKGMASGATSGDDLDDDTLLGAREAVASITDEPPTRPGAEPLQKARTHSRSMEPPDELPGDERELFQRLTMELRRLRQATVHDVLAIPRDADASTVRTGWMALVRRHHPDLVARHGAPAITHLAEELTILANRAYDRLRAALVAEGRVVKVGSAVLQKPSGWLVGFEDIASAESSAARVSREAAQVAPEPAPSPAPSVNRQANPSAGPINEGGEAFESRAREMLGDGKADSAQEVLAAALCVYPRSRPLRSLYYVASAIAALQKGEVMLATSQLETALAHHEHCNEAASVLEHVRRHGGDRTEDVRRFFR